MAGLRLLRTQAGKAPALALELSIPSLLPNSHRTSEQAGN